ncbi:hypothetical protein CKO42_11510 [Lamprobacter modestohalophilus]|uniref:Prepilin-type N-terminal cleavage/methylation domain-containing protein n=1 Tax=Lamprobacter modestohalophilus TaxID=1064514 RepID=A0A9X0W916_9GAMM|nr:type IV pilin protein [Lamprobacter modestohalophilus]MCF7976652.1 prepilin-type N-terminal cleavage/methylation domain-containing protein [Chromatiaceae bacterium]MBK1619046.1 hypothetical protein [Lamprobacter modestohalophilus]MCF7994407.1 prepilin-type N-terminal cleavage/methylation domain-containing protein [Chromatiaceae bacterium]MCF8003557.1 prepilin-type N-terminal cleavage/methylation domain-containing protein [Chromatiaceae bacterium]MCF8014222.1 prepilin-type N-terminal cleavag
MAKKFAVRDQGFTLIETMIVVALIGILTAIAIPSYQSYILKARRADGQAAIGRVLIEQEKYRTGHTIYSSNLSQVGFSAGVGGSYLSSDGHYSLSLSDVTATGFTVNATPRGQQADDSDCNTLTLVLASGGAVTYASGGSTTTDVNGCWKK